MRKSTKQLEESARVFKETLDQIIVPALQGIKVPVRHIDEKIDSVKMLQTIMRVNDTLHKLLHNTPYLYLVEPESTGYGVIITFVHSEFGWMTKYLLDVTEFKAAEKVLWNLFSVKTYDNEEFPTRLRTICSHSGMPIIGSWCIRTKHRISRCRNCGVSTVEFMEKYLKSQGLDFDLQVRDHLRAAISFVEYNYVTHELWEKPIVHTKWSWRPGER